VVRPCSNSIHSWLRYLWTKGLPQGLRIIYCLLSLISFQVGSAFQINLQKLCDTFPQGWNETRYEVRETREVYKFQHHTKLYCKCSTLLVSYLKFKSNFLVFCLLNTAFSTTIPDLIPHVHLAPFVIMLRT